MRKTINKLFLIITVISALLLTTGCDLFIKTNKGQVDQKWYMGLTYEDDNGNDTDYTIETDGTIAAVALEDGYGDEFGIIKGEEAYLNINTIIKNIDKRFYVDATNNLVMFTDATKTYKTKIGGKTINETENTDYVISFMDGKNCYVNVKFVKKYVDFDYKVVKAEGKSPARIVLKYTSGEKNQMTVKGNIEMRTKADYQNLIVTTLKKNTKVTVLEESGDWTKVGTDDGFMGYVPAKKLKDKETKKTEFKSDADTYTHVLMNKKISLGWNAITNLTANGNLETIIEHTKGLNVISPTWYSLSDNKGNLRSYASATYVEKAHSKGLKVWALVNDFGTQDKASKEYTKKVLTDTTKRENLVDNIMTNIKDYNLDGINIDFEFINKDIINSYLQFLRELSIECRKAGKVLSIDNYVPSSGSEYYDIAHQSLVADYIIIMSYDEHYAGSKEAGSVSSMTFTEKAVNDAIALTGNASRVINGMPFYTRAWITTPATDGKKGEGVYVEDATNGNYYLSSQAITMDKAKELYTNAKVKPTFDETTGQNFVSYEKGDSTVNIWLEDATSVKSRLDIMEKYKLAGAAYWRLGQETDSIWDTIYPYFK